MHEFWATPSTTSANFGGSRAGRHSARAAVVVALLLAATIASGCLTSRSNIPGVLRSDLESKDVTVVDTFDASHTHLFLLFGVLPDAPEDLFSTELRAAVENANADGIANVRVESFYTPFDGALNIATLGFLVPRTYRLRADIVRIAPAAPKGRPLVGRAPRGEQ